MTASERNHRVPGCRCVRMGGQYWDAAECDLHRYAPEPKLEQVKAAESADYIMKTLAETGKMEGSGTATAPTVTAPSARSAKEAEVIA